MSNLKLLRTILRLKSLKVTHVRFMHRDTELHLAVKPYKNGCRCPACGRRGRIVHQTSERRRWEDVAVMGLRIVLWYAPKEIQCPTHGRVQEEIPWAPAYARVTYRLEWRLCALCQIMTQQAAAEILRLPTSTLSNLLHRVITRVRHGHKIGVYPGFPTPFWGLSGFVVGDLIGKALWELVENAQRFPRHGGRVLCVHGAVSFHRARPCATRWLPGRGPMRDVELDRCVLGLQSTGEQLCSRQHRRPVHAERSIYPGKTGISGAYAIWETRI